MGLCKCSKKKVTNLFCFEHKVNVCEHCLVEDHDKCIVKSYLQWLEDSDYNPICTLCDRYLQIDDLECIRLVCYDVFHLKCLDDIANTLPDTTAPAGYECPSCTKMIIPQTNQVGPLADSLKGKLSQSKWFQRSMRGKISDETDVDNFEIVEPTQLGDLESNGNQTGRSFTTKDHKSYGSESHNKELNALPVLSPGRQEMSHAADHSVFQMPDAEDQTANIRKSAAGHRPQGLPLTNPSTKQRIVEEENKYSRKPLLTHLATLIKAHFPYSTARRSPQKAYYYFMLTLVMGLVIFVLLLWFFSVLGRYSADSDPMLDPRFNPNLIFPKDNKFVHEKSVNQIVRGSNIQPPKVGG